MNDLINYILKGILGEDEKFEITEETIEGRTNYLIHTDPKNIGLIIGKGGKMINAIRNLIKVRATLEKTAVYISVADSN